MTLKEPVAGLPAGTVGHFARTKLFGVAGWDQVKGSRCSSMNAYRGARRARPHLMRALFPRGVAAQRLGIRHSLLNLSEPGSARDRDLRMPPCASTSMTVSSKNFHEESGELRSPGH